MVLFPSQSTLLASFIRYERGDERKQAVIKGSGSYARRAKERGRKPNWKIAMWLRLGQVGGGWMDFADSS